MSKISETERLFLYLLNVGINRSSFEKERLLEAIDWNLIYRMAQKQAVIAVVYDAVSFLDKKYCPNKQLLFEWFAKTVQIEAMNKRLNQVLKEIIPTFQKENLNPILLKGQGLAQYYPNPYHRQPGDIDLYFGKNYDRADKVAKSISGMTFHHNGTYQRAFLFKGVYVENHEKYFFFYDSKNQSRWEKVQSIVPLIDNEKLLLEDVSIRIPSPQMNILYVFLHIVHHFLLVGIGLRQVCDWAVLWRKKYREIDKNVFLQCVDILHIERLSKALTYIVVNYLGVPNHCIPLDISSQQVRKDGELMLRDILDMGNFGQDSVITRGFVRNQHWHNLKNYYQALRRQISLYRLYPSEIQSYPIYWLKSKF